MTTPVPPAPPAPPPAPWYAAGLRFTCTGCGACCTGAGRVWVSLEDIARLAAALGLDLPTFAEEHLERAAGRWALKERAETGDCGFLRDRRCAVYEARPRQCRTFPWWPTTLQDAAAWGEAGRGCEGVGAPGAPLVSAEDVTRALDEERRGRARAAAGR
ncbi:MAG: YkgJ family cysteine cluster protein [Deltaproteobacteria bacterium]|nr:YkgJ family cysteine cluster protein [Deltaproteobacteria bacterium]